MYVMSYAISCLQKHAGFTCIDKEERTSCKMGSKCKVYPDKPTLTGKRNEHACA